MLVRLEDWVRDVDPARRVDALRTTVDEFSRTLSQASSRLQRPTLLFVAPPSRATRADPELSATLASLERSLTEVVAGLPGLTLITSQLLDAQYPVDVVEDSEGDRQAHVPFSSEYWAAMATVLARRLRRLSDAPYKVIVVDADNTLWGGVVGEVGAAYVHCDDEFRELQTFLLARKNEGMLLALVSKNREADVAEVFRREDMVLRREDFVAWKVNWEPKSRNVAALARELELGPQSFLFLDDNPIECADVSANCAAVTTLLLPSDRTQIPSFIRHVWALTPTQPQWSIASEPSSIASRASVTAIGRRSPASRILSTGSSSK